MCILSWELSSKTLTNCNVHLQELLSSGLFWKNYVQKNFDISDEEFPTGHLKVWQDPDFAYYWDDNEDKSNIYVFSEPPRRWKCGIVHPANFTIESHKDIKYKDFLLAVRILLRTQEAATELELDCGMNVIIDVMMSEMCWFAPFAVFLDFLCCDLIPLISSSLPNIYYKSTCLRLKWINSDYDDEN